MGDLREKLRLDFYSITDTKGGSIPGNWKKYAEWLEDLRIKKINNELFRENELYRKKLNKICEISDI